jgi:hypothetical protein
MRKHAGAAGSVGVRIRSGRENRRPFQGRDGARRLLRGMSPFPGPWFVLLAAGWLFALAADALEGLEAPQFNRPSGPVPTGSVFTLTHANSAGAILFTTDGRDPRTAAGTVYTNTQVYLREVTINSTMAVKARVLSSNLWSPLAEAVFDTAHDYSKLLITELMYQPPGTNSAHERRREFIEIKNVGSETLDLTGVEFRGFVFPANSMIAPDEFKVLVRDTNAFLLDHPGVPIHGGPFARMSNDDSGVQLNHASGAVMFSMSYGTHGPWPTVPDDHNFTDRGFSLVAAQPNALPDPHHYHSWRASSLEGGSPGRDDPPETRPQIEVNELLARPGNGGYPLEAVEFYNPHGTNVDLGGWFLSDSRPDPKRYQIPPGKIIPAGGYLVLDENDFAAGTANDIAFSSYKEGVYLFSAEPAGNLTGSSDGFSYGGSERGMSYGRWKNSFGEEFFVPQSSETIGRANSGPLVGPVVVSEFMYLPPPGEPIYVELTNITDQPVPLYDPAFPTNRWYLVFGGWFTFPTNVVMAPRSLLLVVSGDAAEFRARHGVPADVPVFDGLGVLPSIAFIPPNRLYLARPSGMVNLAGLGMRTREIPVDVIDFMTRYPWPVAAAGSGASLERVALDEFGREPRNWRASPTVSSPGRPNSSPFEVWRASQFTSAELGDHALSGPMADPDMDRLSNLAEYTFGSEPKRPNASPIHAQVMNGQFKITFLKSLAATDVTITAQAASAVTGPWSMAQAELDSGPETSESPFQTISVRDLSGLEAERFLRLRIELNVSTTR